MNRSVIFAVAFNVGIAGVAFAQTPGALLEQHLKPGAELFDAEGHAAGIIQEMELDGSVILREVKVPKTIPNRLYVSEDGTPNAAPENAALKVIPPGSVIWTGYGLKVNLSAAAIAALPTAASAD
jgi:hypothetical protein